MRKHTTLFSALVLLTLLPQQASAFMTIVKQVEEKQYIFQADNAAAPIVGEPGGFKVRILIGDVESDPDLKKATPVTDLTDMLRLNLYHPASGARQTTVFVEESAGLYVARFTPTAPGPYTYTLAALLEGTPLSISITCSGAEEPAAGTAEEGEAAGEAPRNSAAQPGKEEVLREGDIPCPADQGETLMFPPDSAVEFTDTTEASHGSAPTEELQQTIDNLVVSRTILYVITGVNLIMSALFGIMLSRAVF